MHINMLSSSNRRSQRSLDGLGLDHDAVRETINASDNEQS